MRRLLYIFLVVLSGVAFGQGRISSDPSQFVSDIKTKAIISRSDVARSTVNQFETIWDGDAIDEDNKKKIIGIVRYMHKKKMKFHPEITTFLDVVYFGAGYKQFTSETLGGFLTTTAKTFSSQSKQEAMSFLNFTKVLLSESKLSSSADGNVIAKEGEITFTYNDYPVTIEYKSPFEEEKREVEVAEDNSEGTENEDAWGDDGGWDDWGTVEEEPEYEEEEQTEVVTSASFYMAPELPDMVGPTITITNTDLVLTTEYDFTTIYKTNLHINPLSQDVVGVSGSMDWSNAGLPEVVVDIAVYSFNASNPDIIADGVTLKYPEKVEGEVIGILEYKSVPHEGHGTAMYPRFLSYLSDVKVLGLSPGLEFYGGFGLKGRNIYTGSVAGGKGMLYIKEGDTTYSKIMSRNFLITDSTIEAQPSYVVNYLEEDSIYHTGVNFSYDITNKGMKLVRGGGDFKYTPFNDPRRNIDINCNELYWTIGDTVMNFSNGLAKNSTAAYFNSVNFFDYKEFFRLRSLYPFHPAVIVYQHSIKTKSRKFYASEIAEANGFDVSLVKKSCGLLMVYGYIDYDPASGYIVVRDKILHVLESNKGKKDYDVISIKSINPKTHNATLNLNNKVLTVYGAQEFSLSDSNNVNCLPKDGIVEIHDGNNLKFNGRVSTANYVFNGRDFDFDYDDFTLNLAHIDSIKFDVVVDDTTAGADGEKKRLRNKLSYSAGYLQIDKPNNKSGKEPNPIYPRFDADKGASVLFTGNEILGGAYDTTIQYKIPPFKIDSLAGDFNAGLKLDGDFSSGGIFPQFKEPLEVQEDLSFGFKHNVPESGYPLYENDNMRFYGKLSMSNKGLRGKGYVKYLNTTLYSHDFVFFPDSVLAVGDSAVTLPGSHPDAEVGVTFPLMEIQEYEMKWYPREDSMSIGTFGKPFQFYDSYVNLIGVINISKNGAYGNGIMSSKGARTISQKINYSEKTFVAHKADFEILSDVIGKPAMRSDLVKVSVDIDADIATFEPEDERASNEFPFLSYKTSLNEGVWYIDKRRVEMELSEDKDISTSYFYSTRARQDSISFYARKAIYPMDSLRLYVSGIPKINVSDAAIFPENGSIVITKDARILPMKSSRLEIDTIHAYHQFVESEINLLSTSRMVGKAIYKYVNSGGDTLDIVFNKFEYKNVTTEKKNAEDWNTYSETEILEEDKFEIAPQTLFKGVVKMYSTRKPLVFDGFVSLQLSGAQGNTWIPFFKDDDSKDVVVDITAGGKKNEENPNSSGGFYFNVKSRQYYGKFLGGAIEPTDQKAFSTSGALSQSHERKEIIIGDTTALKEGLSGTAFMFNEKRGYFEHVGGFDLLTKYDTHEEEINVSFGGRGKFIQKDSTFELDGIVALNYIIPSKMYEIMADDFQRIGKELAASPAVSYENKLFRNLSNLDGNPKVGVSTEKSMSSGYTPLFHYSKVASEGIVLNNVKLKYNKEVRSWYSVGDIGLSNVSKMDVNAQVKGHLEINKGRKNNRVELFLELEEVWYYFSFNKNSFTGFSSNDEFNLMLNDKATYPGKPWEYFLKAGKKTLKGRFVKRFTDYYINGNTGGALEESVEEEIVEEEPIEEIQEEVDTVIEDDLDDLGSGISDVSDEIEDTKNDKKKKKDAKEEDIVEEEIVEEIQEEVDVVVEDDLDDLGSGVSDVSDEIEGAKNDKKKKKKKKKGEVEE